MSLKINHMICPNCGHDFYVEAAYATCDSCQTHFYAAQSLTRTQPLQQTLPNTTIRLVSTDLKWNTKW